MKVLLTGAAGKLGAWTFQALIARGYDVRATDCRLPAEPHAHFVRADLLDAAAVRELARGCEAIVHVGNHANMLAAPPERLELENTAMNANVFAAGLEHGATRFVFSSTIQVMIPMPAGRPPPPPYPLPFLPLDGSVEANPGSNAYAQSKVGAEAALRRIAAENPEVCCTVLRYPYIAEAAWFGRFAAGKTVAQQRLNYGEALSFLRVEDAARVIVCALERQAPGYHQYFPAQALTLEGVSTTAIIRRYYAHVPLRRPLREITALIDDAALRAELDFEPSPMHPVALEQPWDDGGGTDDGP